METIDRRTFLAVAASIGATIAWGGAAARASQAWRERRDQFPQGVASGDPTG